MKKVKDAFVFLKNQGWIEYDKFIPKNIIEKALDIEDIPNKPWVFIGPLIQLKQYLEKQGYKSTQSVVDDGLKILPANKIKHKIDIRKKKCFNQLNRDKQCAMNVDLDCLSKKEKNDLGHSMHVLSLLTQAMNSILSDIN
jgi:hypothetical protein